MVLSCDVWPRDSVFECGRCHQVVQQSGGSCVLIQVSFWLDIAHREDADTRFPVRVSQAGMRLPLRYVRGAFPACDYLLQTGETYSAKEKHRAGLWCR